MYHEGSVAQHIDGIRLDVLNAIGKVGQILEDQQSILANEECKYQSYSSGSGGGATRYHYVSNEFLRCLNRYHYTPRDIQLGTLNRNDKQIIIVGSTINERRIDYDIKRYQTISTGR